MNETLIETGDFLSLANDILTSGHSLRFRARGRSMAPFVRDRDILTIAPAAAPDIRTGDIAFYSTSEGKIMAHRILGAHWQAGRAVLLARGDASAGRFEIVDPHRIMGKAVLVERDGIPRRLDTRARRVISLLGISLLHIRHVVARAGRRIFRVFPARSMNRPT